MDDGKLKNFVDRLWDDAVVPSLTDYIRIPNKSPAFDKDWATNGHMDKAVVLMESWARAQLAAIPGVSGAHLMAPGNEGAIVDMLKAANGLKRR